MVATRQLLHLTYSNHTIQLGVLQEFVNFSPLVFRNRWCNVLFTTVILQYVDSNWRNVLSSLPGRFPCASWLLAVAQNLPPPDPPNQSEANASFTVMHFSYNLFSYFKTSSTSGSQAAIWSACWPFLAASSAIWSCGYNLKATGNSESLVIAAHTWPLNWRASWSDCGPHTSWVCWSVFWFRHIHSSLFMKDKLNILQLVLPRWRCRAITFTIHNICPCDLVHVPWHLPLQIFLLQLQLCDVGLVMVDHL